MNAIEVKNLTKNYKGFTLNNISFDLPSGCIMGLIGENGAGKSTTMRSILGMIKPDNGNINCDFACVRHEIECIMQVS